jgi:ketosteroid isomerase-like protein
MKYLTILSIALLLISCSEMHHHDEAENKTSKIDIAKELAGIEKTRNNFMLAIKEGRYQDLGKWMTPDIKTIPAGGSGWDDMFRLGQERGRFPYDSIVMKPIETILMNDSTAYDWGSSHVYYTNEEGKAVELRNSFLVILKKQNGEWKLHREVASSVLE